MSRVGLSNNTVNRPPSFTRDYWNQQVGFDAAWEADFWGKYRKAVKEQKAVYVSSIDDYQNALVSLCAEVARTYVAIRTFEELIERGRKNVSIQEESLRIADARFRNGATSELDAAQARELLESTRASIPQFEIGLAQSQNALSTLLGQPTGSLQNLLQGPKTIPAAPSQVAVSIPCGYAAAPSGYPECRTRRQRHSRNALVSQRRSSIRISFSQVRSEFTRPIPV